MRMAPIGAGLVVVCLIGVVAAAARVTLGGGSDGDRTGAESPRPPASTRPVPTRQAPGRPSAPPPGAGPWQPDVGKGFFTPTVLTSRGAYRASRYWTRSCVRDAKPKLAALVRRTPCSGALLGALYRSPDGRVYVQMTAMRFATPGDAARISQAISGDVAPRLHVPYRNEPAHWWSASHAGHHVLIRQSFIPRAREPGPRGGPAQTYGDTLIRRFQAILTGLYAARPRQG
ncbi:hypothetical protein Acsp03_48760 [Actinomadura sp. NBRC 104412]|uniref:hypothetical protein n=1 Tax=Actinomadura sp. NBRC 104412 TaxID=3032203 RepID=UPI0024A1FDD5|nr:hypothetical protein [Actinomadura sp. NBRC 104412]GLZ07410.1 hypothetical protein Acsp03_48760 [Actinomadura sp. NBRC 104412]